MGRISCTQGVFHKNPVSFIKTLHQNKIRLMCVFNDYSSKIGSWGLLLNLVFFTFHPVMRGTLINA